MTLLSQIRDMLSLKADKIGCVHVACDLYVADITYILTDYIYTRVYIYIYIYIYIDRVIPTAILFLLQGVFQLYTTNTQHKHTQFYLFLTTKYFDIL